MDFIAGASPRQMARTAGALYLINIVAGAFAIGLIPAILVVPDMATTAHNIQAHELLYRLGLVAHVVVDVTNVPLAVIFYDLFKVVNRRLALLDVFFILVATSIEAAACSASSHRWSCWAAVTMRALFRPRSCTRWRTCPVTCRR